MSMENIKKLREITGAGFADVKKALDSNNNDLEKSIEWLRKNGIAKAAKKLNNIAAEGIVKAKIVNGKAVIIEINSQTDFVAKNQEFIIFVDKVLDAFLKSKFSNSSKVEDIKKSLLIDSETLEQAEMSLTAKIGEKISLRRFAFIDNAHTSFYNHANSRIAVIISSSPEVKVEILKQIAMHIAAMNPKFVSRANVPSEFEAKELEILKEQYQKEFANDKAKLEKLDFILKGALSKQLAEIVLEEQAFAIDPSKKIKDILSNGKIASFIRFEVGEGIEKQENNFAEEVKKAAGI